MSAKVLFRSSLSEEDELEVCQRYFDVVDSRIGLSDSLVVGRYSCLPYYKELESDLSRQGSRLINSFLQHSYIADFDYYYDLGEMTPKTWFSLHDSRGYSGPRVLKGRTNSRKHLWDESMFAETWEDAVRVSTALMTDSLIQHQGLVVREYVPLRTYEKGIHGLPVTNEWRCFFLGDVLLSYGYYWSGFPEYEGESLPSFLSGGKPLAEASAKILKDKVNFFVVDVAQKGTGEWIVMEVNDGQMSGLSLNSPGTLYSSLREALKEFPCPTV